MSFLADDDRILIMGYGTHAMVGDAYGLFGLPPQRGHDYSLPLDAMKRLVEVGIRTIQLPCPWMVVEPTYRKRRNWYEQDELVGRARQAGLNVMLGVYYAPPRECDPDWYARFENGMPLLSFSIWNHDAWAYEENFVKAVAKRYCKDDPGVMMYSCLSFDGETLMGHEPQWYDKAGLASFECWVADKEKNLANAKSSGWLCESVLSKFVAWQKVLHKYQEHNDVWTALHPMINPYPTGTQYVRELYKRFAHDLPESELFWQLYTYYGHGPDYRKQWREWAKEMNAQLVGGAEYCKGMREYSVADAKKDGNRLLCGVLHPWQPDLFMTDEMFDTLAWGVKELGGEGAAR